MSMRWKVTCGRRSLVAKSCSICGLLKDASAFFKDKRGYRSSWCNPCQSEKSNPRAQQRNELVKPDASRTKAAWTSEDLETLERMADEGVPPVEIAKKLKRTYFAVANARSRQLKANRE